MKGELQVSDKERQAEYESKFKDIATLVAGRCVNTNTHWPFPVTTIETAMKETIHFSVNPNKNTKQQAKEVEERLKEHLPLARARMHLKLTLPSSSKNSIPYYTMELEKIISPTNGKIIVPSSSSSNQEEDVNVVFEVIIDPHLFRELENYIKQKPGSSLGILQFNLQAANDADLEEVVNGVKNIGSSSNSNKNNEDEDNDFNDTIDDKNNKKKINKNKNKNNKEEEEELNSQQQIVMNQNDFVVVKESLSSSIVNDSSLKCTMCGMDFGSDRNLQRLHYKSDFHTYNLKLKATSLPSVSLLEFNNMSDEDKKAVLFDWKC